MSEDNECREIEIDPKIALDLLEEKFGPINTTDYENLGIRLESIEANHDTGVTTLTFIKEP